MSGIPPHLTRGRGRGFVILDNEFLSRRGATASAARAAPFVPVSRGSRGNFLQNLIASAETSASAQTSGGATAAISRTRGTTREDMGAHIYTTKPENIESKVGKDGAPVKLITNYFRLLKKPDFEFNLYRVDFNPDVDIEGLRKSFLFKQKEILGGYLFDGQSMVYLTHRLEEDIMNFECEDRENNKYTMTLQNTGTSIQMTDASAMQVLNLILRRAMDGLEMQLVGRNMYYPQNRVIIKEHKVELWPGYITSIRQHEEDVLVCCEVSHKVMRMQTVYEVLVNHRKDDAENFKDNFKREIIGSTVLTDYNNNTYRVDDIDFMATPKLTFISKKKGEVKEISYIEYYKARYDLTIKDENQPMLVSKPKPRDVRAGNDQVLYLVPELCRPTGLTDKMRANFHMMKAMAEHTQMDPEKRSHRLLQFATKLQESETSKKQLKDFSCDIERQLVSFNGRALKQETMLFGNNQSSVNDNRVDWTVAWRKNSMYLSVPLKRWVVMYPKRCVNESQSFLELMKTAASGMSYEMAAPMIVELPDDRIPTYINAIDEAAAKDPKLIMIVVPNNAADRYSSIKKLTCVTRSVPTQVVVSKTMQPKKGGNPSGILSIATKVMIQINCKLGGAAWMVNFPLKGVMTIGFDVTHDSKNRNNSYGAFVASMDVKECVKYYSGVSKHKNGSEMSANIEIHLMKALAAFREEHGTLPSRLFFYRDGVGEGDIEYVHAKEVSRLNEKLLEVYGKTDEQGPPKLTFIVVNKRINTRFFAQSGGTLKNPDSGTVVDNTVTLPERYDFYLISQSVRQGTVSPTSYNVIYDTNGLSPDKVQSLTYKQSHLYYNWCGPTRVPAVTQYAHKLAMLVGEYLHELPSEKFNNQLYFL